MLLTAIFLAIVSLKLVKALECGLILGDMDKEVDMVITTCLKPTIPVVEVKVNNSTNIAEITDANDPEEVPLYGPRRGMGQRPKRQEPTTIAPASSSTTSTTPKPTTQTPAPDVFKGRPGDDPKRCVVRCIFKDFKMLDAKGIPDHKGLSNALLRYIKNRELHDFVTDSIDDCFGQMLDLVDADTCGFSAKLITCLAEKGRYNCADWPVGELPFPHPF